MYPKEIELVAVDKLIPYVNNPKQHPERQIDIIASSIKNFGFINPIIVDAHNEIVAGHGRLLAAKKLGLQAVPVLRVEHLTPAQVRAYRIADNKLSELGEWDEGLLAVELKFLQEENFDLSLTGFELEEIADLTLDFDDTPDGSDDVPNMSEEIDPVTQPGDLWIMGKHRLLCGDSTKWEDVERPMGTRKVPRPSLRRATDALHKRIAI